MHPIEDIEPDAWYSFSYARQFIPGRKHKQVSLSTLHRWRDEGVLRPEEVSARETRSGRQAWFMSGAALVRLSMRDQVPAAQPATTVRSPAQRTKGYEAAMASLREMGVIVTTTEDA